MVIWDGPGGTGVNMSKNCKTIDLRGAQVKEMVIWDGCPHVKKIAKQ